MLFSIVVPVYNVEKYLVECLESIINQLPDISYDAEIILVDDGSTDKSYDICEQYNKDYPNIITVIHKENGGLLSARRTGFAVAKGEYIINCDSDDKLMPKALTYVVQGIEKTHADVIFYNANTFDTEHSSRAWFTNIFSENEFSIINKERVWENYFEGYATVSMCCKAFQKKCLATPDKYDDFPKVNMGEDSLQSIEIYTRAEAFAYINKPLYGYRMSSGMTSKFVPDFYEQMKVVLEEILENKNEIAVKRFDEKFAKKLFDIVGRSITQGRSIRQLGYVGEIGYMSKIRNDDLVKEYERYYVSVRDKISKSHRIINDLLLKNHFTTIFILIKLMNILKDG